MKQSRIITCMTFLLVGLMWSINVGNRDGSLAFAEPLAQVAQAQEEGKEDNQSDASKNAEGKLTGATDMATETWNRVKDWVMGYVNALRAKVDTVFGFDKGEGSGAFFGTVFYFAIILVIWFVLMFIYNIFNDMFSGMAAKKKYKKRR